MVLIVISPLETRNAKGLGIHLLTLSGDEVIRQQIDIW